MCRASCKGAPASALNNATSRCTMWKGRAGMVQRSMRGCESYPTADGRLLGKSPWFEVMEATANPSVVKVAFGMYRYFPSWKIYVCHRWAPLF
ncbi:hypothetical protein D3C71_1696040 [compost metagenome]